MMIKKLAVLSALACAFSAPAGAQSLTFYVNGQALPLMGTYSTASIPANRQLTVGYAASGVSSCRAVFSARREIPYQSPVNFDTSTTFYNLPTSYSYQQYFDPAYRYFRYDVICAIPPSYAETMWQLILQ